MRRRRCLSRRGWRPGRRRQAPPAASSFARRPSGDPCICEQLGCASEAGLYDLPSSLREALAHHCSWQGFSPPLPLSCRGVTARPSLEDVRFLARVLRQRLVAHADAAMRS